jgi:uncharacterized membrane protein SpoIIM required for sporulation
METAILKSNQFRREREPSWLELENLLKKLEKGSPRSLTAAELVRLPTLYRGALSSLSVARSISLDQGLLDYLENLANRAYFQVYGPRDGLLTVIGAFLRHRWPAAVRSLGGPVLLSILVTAMGAIVGFLLCSHDSEWYYSLMSGGMTQGRLPTSSTESLRHIIYDTDVPGNDWLSVFASFLFVHNAGIGIACFALGFAFGLPTILLLLANGLGLGAFVWLYASRGMGMEIGGWLIIHGSTELLAVALCGGAGLALAQALLFPGARGRLAALAERGRAAGQVALGAVIMLVFAGVLEGFARQLVTELWARWSIGLIMLGFWTIYFLQPGPAALASLDDDDDR